MLTNYLYSIVDLNNDSNTEVDIGFFKIDDTSNTSLEDKLLDLNKGEDNKLKYN